jgi:DNA polymerase-3 subunit delta
LKIRANQLSSHLKKSLAPCYLVTGDEHLLVSEALDAIRDAAKARGFGNRELHVATTGFDWVQLTASTGNMSLFAEQRIRDRAQARQGKYECQVGKDARSERRKSACLANYAT